MSISQSRPRPASCQGISRVLLFEKCDLKDQLYFIVLETLLAIFDITGSCKHLVMYISGTWVGINYKGGTLFFPGM